MRADLGLGYGGDLVYHQPAGRTQAVALIRLDDEAEQRCVGRIGGEGANGDGVGRVETVVLHDDDRARLASVILAARDGPDLAAPHSSSRSARRR
jgi:hypothetical protein